MNEHFNYSKNFNNPQVEEPVEETVVVPEVEPVDVLAEDALTPQQPVVPQPEPEKAPAKKGVVVNCDKLNVRKAPTKGSDAIAQITKGNEVIINEAESKGGFYKISTVSGLEGYCMKAYIEIK